jgi:hypothetical protein
LSVTREGAIAHLSRLLISIALTCGPIPVAAQLSPTATDCIKAVAAVSGKPLPPPGDSLVFTWQIVRACGSAADAAIASALATPAVIQESDSSRVLEFFTTLADRRSRTIFAALTELVKSTTASGPIRSEAVRALGQNICLVSRLAQQIFL